MSDVCKEQQLPLYSLKDPSGIEIYIHNSIHIGPPNMTGKFQIFPTNGYEDIGPQKFMLLMETTWRIRLPESVSVLQNEIYDKIFNVSENRQFSLTNKYHH